MTFVYNNPPIRSTWSVEKTKPPTSNFNVSYFHWLQWYEIPRLERIRNRVRGPHITLLTIIEWDQRLRSFKNSNHPISEPRKYKIITRKKKLLSDKKPKPKFSSAITLFRKRKSWKMSTQNGNRRSSFSSSTTSSLAKRHASENVGKPTASLAKKRVPLGNISNQRNTSRSSVSASSLVGIEFFFVYVKSFLVHCFWVFFFWDNAL